MIEPTVAEEHVITQTQATSLELREGTSDVHAGRLRRRRRVLQGMCSAAVIAALVLGASALDSRDGQTVRQIPAVDRGSGSGAGDEIGAAGDDHYEAAGYAAPDPLPKLSGGADRVLPNGGVVSPLSGGRAARQADVAMMLETLGPDWRVRARGPRGDVEVIPGSPTARALPEAYQAAASLLLLPAPDRRPALADLCRAHATKRTRWSSCTSLTLPDGRVVQVQAMRTDLDATGYAWDATLAFYEGATGVVGIEFAVYDFEDADPDRQAPAIAWLEQQAELVATLAVQDYLT